MPLADAPMVMAKRDQHGVAQGEIRLRDIAADKIGVARRELAFLQPLLREQQTGTAIHQEPGRLVQRDLRGIAVVRAGGELLLAADEPAVADDQVIGKHADRGRGELAQRRDLELHLDAGLRRENLAEHMQGAAETKFVEVAVAAKADVEFEIVVRARAGRRLEYSAFAATVTAAQQDCLEFSARHEPPDAGGDFRADQRKMLFQLRSAVGGEVFAAQ